MSCGSNLHHTWVDVTALGEQPMSHWVCSDCGIRQQIVYHTILEESLNIPTICADGGFGRITIGPMAYGETQDYIVGDVRHVVHRAWKS